MPTRWKIAVFLLMGFFVTAQAQEEQVIFSVPGGFYEQSFCLSLDCFYPGHHVRYTTNGAKPTAQSPLYEAPLCLDERYFSPSCIHTIPVAPNDEMYYPASVEKCVVIRAAVFDDRDSCLSRTFTNTYLIQSLGNPPRGLPVVSLCADSIDLFGHEQGILVPGAHFNPSDPQWTGNYYQTGKEWERCVNVEFYETDNSGINQEAGLRTHGGNGRRFQQKSLKIYAREEYGKKRFKHPFFGSLSIKSFKHLTLKPFKSSWTQAGLEDHLCGNLAQSFENVEALASRPVILFLNGEYWGIYYLHEKADERYLEDHFDIDLDLCDIVGNWVNNCEYGHADDFFETLDHLARADLNDPVEYHRIEETFDLDSFIDYQILELFFANLDWPSNNMRCWREQGGKWRWIFYDGDACFKSQSFDVFANATYTGSAIWPSRTRATLLFRRLLANDTFREKFFLRFKELLSTRFQYPATRDLLEEIQDQISSEIPAQANRFGIPQNKKTWLQDCEKIDKFLRDRTEELERQMEHFIQSETWAFGEWICYFDPGTDGLTLSFHTNQPGTAPLTVHDLTGRCLYAETRDIQSGFNSIHLQLSLKTGVYILTIGTHQQIICKY